MVLFWSGLAHKFWFSFLKLWALGIVLLPCQVSIWVVSFDVPPSLREREVFGAFEAPPLFAFWY